jgi:hypothetical protein
MAQYMPDGCPLFVARAELWPVGNNRLVVVDLSQFRQPVHARRGNAPGRGQQHEQGIALHRWPRPLVGQASPGIDDQLTVEVRGDLETDLGSAVDKPLEHGLHSGIRVRDRHGPTRAWPSGVQSWGPRRTPGSECRTRSPRFRDHRYAMTRILFVRDWNTFMTMSRISSSLKLAPGGRGERGRDVAEFQK